MKQNNVTFLQRKTVSFNWKNISDTNGQNFPGTHCRLNEKFDNEVIWYALHMTLHS